MNERNDKAANHEDRLLVTRAKELFDQSVQKIDAATQSRLNRGRQAALAQGRRGVGYVRLLQWAPVAGVAAAAVLAVVFWSGIAPVDELAPAAAGDFEILLAEDSFEMLEELEFYSWLDLEAAEDDEVDANGNIG